MAMNNMCKDVIMQLIYIAFALLESLYGHEEIQKYKELEKRKKTSEG